jgi:hypothetical protein
MTFITMNQIKLNLKNFHYKKIDDKAEHLFNDILLKYLKNTVGKICKKHKTVQVIELKHVMNGGRIVQSSEWYGVDSGKYHENVDIVSTNATNELIRPALSVHDPSGFIQDGGASYKISMSAFKKAIEKVEDEYRVKVSSKAVKELYDKFNTKVTEVLSKMKKDTEFHTKHFSDIIKMKKHCILH